jgi:hypothetical protein
MRIMAPFSAVNAAFQRLVRDASLSVEEFAALASELWERSGWTPDEYKAFARGDVIVIDAE